jgi:hypothetical protein
MRRTTFALLLALALATIAGLRGEAKAASCPTVTCTPGGGDPSLFTAGTFGCTLVSTSSGGVITVSLVEIGSDGAGNINQFATATNNTNGSGTTFTDWTSKGTNGTYCLNPDQSGYIFPPAAAGICPFAIFIDISGFEVRLLDSTQNTAAAAVCEMQ